jgi:glycerol uptake facilitator-like aquaporin
LTTARRLTAEFVGTFALVFAGCGAIMVDTKTNALGPARSIGPAFVSGDLNALWIYITAPLAGAALGVAIYQFLRSSQ